MRQLIELADEWFRVILMFAASSARRQVNATPCAGGISCPAPGCPRVETRVDTFCIKKTSPSPRELADHAAAMRAAGPCKAGGRARAFLRRSCPGRQVDNARVRVMIDIASGDAVEPGVQEPICRCS